MSYIYEVKVTRMNDDESIETVYHNYTGSEDVFFTLAGQGARAVDKDKIDQACFEEEVGDTEDSNSHPVEGICEHMPDDPDVDECHFCDFKKEVCN